MTRLHVVAVSHGTDNRHGQQQLHQLRGQLEQLAAAGDQPVLRAVEVRWHEAYVDVQEPRLPQVLQRLPAAEPAIVLPLLVADGVHTTQDIAQAVAGRPGTVAAAPLGELDTLAEVLAQRAAPHLDGAEQVVLAAAGTRLPAGQRQIAALGQRLGERLGRPVSVAYCAGAEPRVAGLLAETGGRTVLLSALLAEGFFQDKLHSTGAWQVTRPLLPDVMIAQCFLERLLQALHTVPGMTKNVEIEDR